MGRSSPTGTSPRQRGECLDHDLWSSLVVFIVTLNAGVDLVWRLAPLFSLCRRLVPGGHFEAEPRQGIFGSSIAKYRSDLSPFIVCLGGIIRINISSRVPRSNPDDFDRICVYIFVC